MNGQAMNNAWSNSTQPKRNIMWYIPAVLMFASLCLQIAAQSGRTTGHHFVVASRPSSPVMD